LHTPQIQEYFGIPFDNLKSSPNLVNYLIKNYSGMLNDFVVVSPDAGGGKRTESLHKALGNKGVNADLAICYKRRLRDNQVAEIKIMGDVNGKNCLILDDIIDTGGTIIKTADVLKKAGAKSVMAYGTHGLFSDGTEKFEDLDKILVSDTISNEWSDNLEIISLVELFGEAIYRTIMGQSLSVLFD